MEGAVFNFTHFDLDRVLLLPFAFALGAAPIDFGLLGENLVVAGVGAVVVGFESFGFGVVFGFPCVEC